jgi:signal peptidase I
VNARSLADYRRTAQAVIAAQPIERLRLQVISDSMWPLLRAGDAVIVQPIEPATIRIGDVLVAQRGGESITHRLIALEGEQWVMRGDNAIWADAPVGRAEGVGRVEAIERGAYRIDLAQPQWAQLNQRLGQIGRVHRRINRWLRLTPASPPLAIRLAWLIALPFRALAHRLVMQVPAVFDETYL